MHDAMTNMDHKFQPTEGNATLTQGKPGGKIFKDDNFATKDTTTSCKDGVCQVTECVNGKCMEFQKKQKSEGPSEQVKTASGKQVVKPQENKPARSISFKKPDGTKGTKSAKYETPKAEMKTQQNKNQTQT